MNDGRKHIRLLSSHHVMGVFLSFLFMVEEEGEKNSMVNNWKEYLSLNDIPINDQYFLVYCETREKMESYARMLHEEHGFKRINVNPGNIPRGPWVYVNLNTMLMFHGNIGVNVLEGPVIGNHALTMDDFLQIVKIYGV